MVVAESMASGFERPGGGVWPVWLLARVNALTLWRRFKAVAEQSRLLAVVILGFIGGYLVVAFWLFYVALRFVQRFPGLGLILTERLLFLLFAFLFVLLLLSNLIIGYTNLFRNRETAYLVGLPISAASIFRWKYVESTLVASWAFLFLIAPLLAAYGLTRGVRWHFYPATVVAVGLFIVLPAVAGAWTAVSVARRLDRRMFQVLAVVGVAALLAAAAWWFRPAPVALESTDTRVLAVLDRLLGRTHFAQHPLLPSCWLSWSVQLWAEGAIRAAVYYGLVLLSYALFFTTLAFRRLGGPFYEAFSTVQSRGSVFARWGWFQAHQQRLEDHTCRPGPAERAVRHLEFLRPDVRALVVKDARMFWRDTTQWAQSLMLFGLLGVYIFNLRHFSQQLGSPFWIHLVSYLNLGACSLNLATLTTRFVFPQFSLEGKRLWIIGLAPMGLERLVQVKYWLATGSSLVVTVTLILLSCHMLDMRGLDTLFFVAAVAAMTFTLNGLSVGLGVLYPNFKEDNPTKIVSGFGGTFCLVLSFLYILASVVLLAFSKPWTASHPPATARAFGCVAGFLALSAVLGWVPLRFGFRRLRSFEAGM
ncbi:MAG: hypothetical protein JXQ71_12515 [Verrucomicrobia bacterium]|nr:hypothetical protein [Verrucomicrobiota bacterium]